MNRTTPSVVDKQKNTPHTRGAYKKGDNIALFIIIIFSSAPILAEQNKATDLFQALLAKHLPQFFA